MDSFKTWLAAQEPIVLEERRQRELLRKDWMEAIHDLLETMQGWILQVDQHRIITTTQTVVTKQEFQLGSYDIPEMRFTLGSRYAVATPIARIVLGPLSKPEPGEWTGRVDFKSPDDSYEIYRLTPRQGDGDRWFLRSGVSSLVTFDQERFELCLMRLMS